MRIRFGPVTRGLTALLAVGGLPACDADIDRSAAVSAPRMSPTLPAASSGPAPVPPTATGGGSGPAAAPSRTEKWVELAVGDCLVDLPPADPSVVTVAIVDCAAPHRAEVYLRVPTAVDAATADVADDKCAGGLPAYTGQSADNAALAVTYLIDSNQDRTVSNPDPSTVICLLHGANGEPLTGSAHRP